MRKGIYVLLLVIPLGAIGFYAIIKFNQPDTTSITLEYEGKHLAVGLAGMTTTDKLPHLVGSYKYYSNGEEIVEEIDVEGGMAWNFSGDYISEVKVQNVAGSGYFQLFVSEDKESLLATEAIEDDRVVVYEK